MVTTKKAASQKKTISKIVKKAITQAQETKNHIKFNTEFQYSTLTSPSGFFHLATIPQGTGAHQRIGDGISPTYLDVRGQVQATNQEAVWYRIYVLEKNVAADPTQDLLETNNGNFAPATSDLAAIYARVNHQKYKVLATRLLKTGTMSNTANDANAAQLFHMKIPMKGKLIYDDNATDPQKRDLVLLVMGRRANNDDTLGLNFEFSFNSKLYFKDN